VRESERDRKERKRGIRDRKREKYIYNIERGEGK
jgi:hypothetical protein